ncbi:MAG: hypothetical protein ABIH18_06950 [Candidatus Omnitrophota bacterium]
MAINKTSLINSCQNYYQDKGPKNFLSSKKELLCILLIIIITAMFYLPLLKNIPNTTINENDWWRNYYYAALSKTTILEYHQLPLRTPYLSGGYPFIAHPSNFCLTPFFILILLFGEITGIRLMAFLIFIIGASGMFYLTRHVLKYSLISTMFSSLLFILCNWGAYEAIDGNLEKLFFYLLPWLMAFFIKCKTDKKSIIYLVLTLSLIFLSNPLILFPILLFLFLFSCLNIITITNKRKINISFFYISIFFITVICSLLVSSVKTLPFLQLFSQKIPSDITPYKDSYTFISASIKGFGACLNLSQLKDSLLDPNFRGYSTMYLGYIPLLIFIISIFYSKRVLNYVVIFFIFLLIQFGPNSPIDLFKYLSRLIPFDYSMWRLNKYFGFFPPFLISIISGNFLNELHIKQKFIKFLILLTLIAGITNIFYHSRLLFRDLVYEKIPICKKYPSFFQAEIFKKEEPRDLPGYNGFKDIRSYQPFWILLNQNIGLVNFIQHGIINIGEYAVPKYFIKTGGLKKECVYVENFYDLPKNESVDLTLSGTINPAYKGEIYTLNQKNKTELLYFSPNDIKIKITLKQPDTLIINQNYHKSWKTDNGEIFNYQGLLGIKLNITGSYIINLKYKPLDFFVGLWISIFSITALIIYLINVKKTTYN